MILKVWDQKKPLGKWWFYDEIERVVVRDLSGTADEVRAERKLEADHARLNVSRDDFESAYSFCVRLTNGEEFVVLCNQGYILSNDGRTVEAYR